VKACIFDLDGAYIESMGVWIQYERISKSPLARPLDKYDDVSYSLPYESNRDDSR